MRRIAVQKAFVTQDVVSGWQDVLGQPDAEPGFAKLGGIMMSPAGKPLVDNLLEIGARRLARMDAAGIDMQVLALTAPGVQVLETGLATRLAADANDVLAEAIKAYPTRFAGLAAVAPPGSDGGGARDRARGDSTWPARCDHQLPHQGRVSRPAQVPAPPRQCASWMWRTSPKTSAG